jgi:hypothetical protein
LLCSARKSLTDADHAAAVRIGREDKHLVAIESEYWDTIAAKADDSHSTSAPQVVAEQAKTQTAEAQLSRRRRQSKESAIGANPKTGTAAVAAQLRETRTEEEGVAYLREQH